MSYSVIAKEWFDRVNGNSYFSARIYKDGEVITVLPFQYGYGSHYEYEAKRVIAELEGDSSIIKKFATDVFTMSEKIEKCLQRDVKQWGNIECFDNRLKLAACAFVQ